MAAPATGDAATPVTAVAAAPVPQRSVSLPFLNAADLATVIDNEVTARSDGVENEGVPAMPVRSSRERPQSAGRIEGAEARMIRS